MFGILHEKSSLLLNLIYLFLVFSDYGRYGHDFRVCDGCMWLGGREYQDVLMGAQVLKLKYLNKNSRIGIHGLSYGGLNVLQAMTRDPKIFACGAANAPVFNWVSQARYDGDTYVKITHNHLSIAECGHKVIEKKIRSITYLNAQCDFNVDMVMCNLIFEIAVFGDFPLVGFQNAFNFPYFIDLVF